VLTTARDKLRDMLRLVVWRTPEALLVLFLVSLAPLVYFLGAAMLRTVIRFAADSDLFVNSLKRDPWPLVTWIVCVGGGVGLGFLMFRWRTFIWAVARKLILEAMHRKVVIVLLVFFAILMPSLPFILKTEGNPKSQIQIVLTYALALAEVLLCLVAVFLCTASMCGEIESKHVQVTDTKPLARWQFLVGKLFGVVVLCSAVLFLMAAPVYLLVRYMGRDRDFSHLSPAEMQRQQRRLQMAQYEVFSSRRAIAAPLPDVTAAVEAEIQKLRAQGELGHPKAQAQKRRDLTNDFQRWQLTVAPNAAIGWHIYGLTPNTKEWLFVRFKLQSLNLKSDRQLAGAWQFYWPGDPTKEGTGGEAEGHLRLVGQMTGYWAAWSYQEIQVPGNVVDPNGGVHVVYRNLQPDTSVAFYPEDNIQFLQRVEGFFPNYYRSLLVILCHVVLLSALALMASSALSFPVASLTVAGIFIAGLVAPWVSAQNTNLLIGETSSGAGFVAVRVYWLLKVAMHGIAAVVPNFTRYSPISNLVNGKLVSWYFVGQSATVLCFLQGTVVMLLAVYFYHRRELARVIV